ncbi:MAG TPA: aromatic-ring-hydroxylating dioxygenase subunit beta [Ramlibacter sp.]|nr:aromatic-ring-hydroxylating dioxygenase subunit beta [Ramlibacter sp.]
MGNASVQNDAQTRVALRDFYEQYTSCLDGTNFDRWLSFFTPDANYRITSRENFERKLPIAAMSCIGRGAIQDRVTALQKVLVFEPRIWRRYVSSVRIERVEGNRVFSRANFLLYEAMMDREPQLNMLGEYVDEIHWADGQFVIQDRSCVYDNYRILTTLFAPV